MQDALHNLAQHDGSPPSSTSHHSVASLSSAAPSQPAARTSITANECFDGSSLFDSTASTGLDAAALTGAQWVGQQSSQTSQPEEKLITQPRPDAAQAGSRSSYCEESASEQMLAQAQLSTCYVSLEQQQLQGQQQEQLQRQQQEQLQRQQQGQQQQSCDAQSVCAPDPLQQQAEPRQPRLAGARPVSQIPAGAQMKQHAQSPADPQHSRRSDSFEDLMTLDELEGRIASLNKTLLRVPCDAQSSHAPPPPDGSARPERRSVAHQHSQDAAPGQQSTSCRHARPAEQRTRMQQQQQVRIDPMMPAAQGHASTSLHMNRHPDVANHRVHSMSQHNGKPAMTAWQKLTAKHQQPHTGSSRHVHASDGETDVCTPACSPAVSRVSMQCWTYTFVIAYISAQRFSVQHPADNDQRVLVIRAMACHCSCLRQAVESSCAAAAAHVCCQELCKAWMSK